jgi:hypothetical protein
MVSERDIDWGGSGIEKVVFDFIRERVPEGSVVLEFGAGHVSTRALSSHYELYSIESVEKYIGIYTEANYVYAPIKDGWYDVKFWMFPSYYKLVLIDGPIENRLGILKHLESMNPDAVYIVHDTNRESEQKLALELGKTFKRPVTFYQEGDYWAAI